MSSNLEFDLNLPFNLVTWFKSIFLKIGDNESPGNFTNSWIIAIKPKANESPDITINKLNRIHKLIVNNKQNCVKMVLNVEFVGVKTEYVGQNFHLS